MEKYNLIHLKKKVKIKESPCTIHYSIVYSERDYSSIIINIGTRIKFVKARNSITVLFL